MYEYVHMNVYCDGRRSNDSLAATSFPAYSFPGISLQAPSTGNASNKHLSFLQSAISADLIVILQSIPSRK